MFFAVMWDLFLLRAKLDSEVMTLLTIVVDGGRFEDEVDNTTIMVTSVGGIHRLKRPTAEEIILL